MSGITTKLFGGLYRKRWFQIIKNHIRPFKHFLFGKDGIYRAIEVVSQKCGGRENVKVILDIGAAVGEYSEHFLKAFPNATVYAFEPILLSREILKKTTKRFGNRIRIFPFGLFSREDVLTFHVVSDHRDGTSCVDENNGADHVQLVEVKRLDDVALELGIERVDFAKIDVEGSELDVIIGGSETLKRTKTAFIELGEYSCKKGLYVDIMKRLRDVGLNLKWADGDYFFSKNE